MLCVVSPEDLTDKILSSKYFVIEIGNWRIAVMMKTENNMKHNITRSTFPMCELPLLPTVQNFRIARLNFLENFFSAEL